MCKVELMGLTHAKVGSFLAGHGIVQSYRTDQLFKWIYHHKVLEFDEMGNLPGDMRSKLKKHASLSLPDEIDVHREGSAVRFVFSDGALDKRAVYEGVLITDTREDGKERTTACISSQAGCNLGCSFCATGQIGLIRNLTASEIIGQLFYMADYAKNTSPITNVVFMGMGEPLQNYENVLEAIEIINSDLAFGIGARRITVSTAGLVPEIRKLADSGFKVRLAISLNAPNDNLRQKLMPIAKRYTINEILDAAEYFYHATGRWVTLEYVMLSGVNDSIENAIELSEKISGKDVKVNLIPFNPVDGLGYSRSDTAVIQRFQAQLLANGITATIRNSQGSNIDAACGQLAGK